MGTLIATPALAPDDSCEPKIYDSRSVPLDTLMDDLERQRRALQERFSLPKATDFDRRFATHVASGLIKLPRGAERWAITRRDRKVLHGSGNPFPEQDVCDALGRMNGGRIERQTGTQFRKERFRDGKHADAIWRVARTQQVACEFMIIAVQLGARHHNHGLRRVESRMLAENEGGLSLFDSGMVLLTHEWRLQGPRDLVLVCLGSQFDPTQSGIFDYRPIIYYNRGRLRLDHKQIDHLDNALSGPATMFLPEVPAELVGDGG